MDKLSRTLLEAEDNSVRLNKLEGEVRQLSAALALTCVAGKRCSGYITFGRYNADGVVIAVFSGNSRTLTFAGSVIGQGDSPLIALISGTGALELSGEGDGYVVLTGAVAQ